jgi:hypothetical protein
MDVAALGVMIPIVAIIGAFFMIIYLRKYQNDERMAMIEKGVGPEFLNMKGEDNPSLSLRMSLLFIGVGVGLFIGYFLDVHFGMEEVGYFSMIFFFGGVGLGVAYLIEEKKLKEKDRH